MNIFDKKDGIYEEVISDSLNKELKNVDVNKKHTEKMDPVETPDILAEYAANIIKNKLASIQDRSDNLNEQIALINKIIDVVSDDEENYEEDKVSEDGEQLKALLVNDPLADIVGVKASDLVRPITSIADTSLFTGSGREPNMSSEIIKEIESCDQIDMMVSFIRWSGVVLILDKLREFTNSGKKLRIITTSYMGATELKAIDALSKLQNTEIKVSYDGDRTRLHAKVYIFRRNTGYSTAYVGSSNLTAPAMTSGCEWNVKVTKNDLPDVFEKIEGSYNGYWNSKEFELYTEEKRDILREALSRSGKKGSGAGVKRHFYFDLYPYPYQQAILDKLDAEREIRGSYKNLICAATGTGKTIISAFDYKRQCEKSKRKLKLLFIAHRKEILEQSIECYREVLKDSEFAELFFSGNEPGQLDFLFASVDILNSREITRLPEDYYDYIVIDECHHIAADSYKTIFEHFNPKYYLGLTATPERMDNKDILKYFNNRLAAEIRLPEAINRKLLCPFQYFGVSDTVDLDELKWSRGGYEKSELENVYVLSREVADKRAAHIIKSIDKYVQDIDNVKGIAFCVSVAHAEYMAEKFNEAGIPARALTGTTGAKERTDIRMQLELGQIKFVCVVDVYNEGVDIKQVNTVLFLRPTESMTIFLQQLGRGLRLAEGKDCLTVLDFIGQANRKYSFEQKFSALLQAHNQGIKKEIDSDFPHLPRGCFVKLEKKAKEAVLANIKAALNGKKGIISKLENFTDDTGLTFELEKFLEHYEMIPEMIYTHKLTATETLSPKACGTEPNMWKKLYRLSSLDSASVLSYMLRNLPMIDAIDPSELTKKELGYWKILYGTFIDDFKPEDDYNLITNLKTYWRDNRDFITETLGVMNFNLNRIDFIERDPELPYENALKVYSTYTRAQALAALDFWKTSSEGVTRVKEKKTTCLFITLNKGNNYYSPSTAYHDYSINEELFHWQSQNATGANTSVGQRYIHHKEQKENILIFVREQKDGPLGSVPFMFLGKGNFVSYQGEKPMSIIWKLDNKIPAKFLEVTDQLGIG